MYWSPFFPPKLPFRSSFCKNTNKDIFSFPSSVVLSSTAPSGAIDRDAERKLLVGSRATFIAQLLCLANSF